MKQLTKLMQHPDSSPQESWDDDDKFNIDLVFAKSMREKALSTLESARTVVPMLNVWGGCFGDSRS